MRRIGTIGLMLVLALAVLALAGIPAAEGAGFGVCKSSEGGEYGRGGHLRSGNGAKQRAPELDTRGSG